MPTPKFMLIRYRWYQRCDVKMPELLWYRKEMIKNYATYAEWCTARKKKHQNSEISPQGWEKSVESLISLYNRMFSFGTLFIHFLKLNAKRS